MQLRLGEHSAVDPSGQGYIQCAISFAMLAALWRPRACGSLDSISKFSRGNKTLVLLFLLWAYNNRLDQRLNLLSQEAVAGHALDFEGGQGTAFDQSPDNIWRDTEDTRGLRH